MGFIQEILASLQIFEAEGSRRPSTRVWLALVLLLALSTMPASAAETLIRPVTSAERAAVGWALEYLDGGADAWVEHLAPGSPWYRSPDAATEIELRAGPPAGAKWRLATAAEPGTAVFHIEMASGHEEVLRIQVADADGVAQIAGLEAGWEVPASGSRSPAATTADTTTDTDAKAQQPAKSSLFAGSPWVLILVFALAGLMATLFAILKPDARAIFGLFALVAWGLAVWFFLGRNASPPAKDAAAVTAEASGGSAKGGEDRLTWRRQLGLGESHLESLPTGEGPIQLWAAEEALLSHRLDLAAKALKAAGASHAGSPTALRLKGRLATARGDGTGALLAFQELVRIWPHDEAFRIEAVNVAERFGFEKQAMELLAPLRKWKSRWAEVQHRLALQNAIDGLILSAAEALEQAIHLEPTWRVDLLASPLAAVLIEAAPKLRAQLALDASREPVVACPPGTAREVALAAGQKAVRIGYSVRFLVKDAELDAPGACVLAPSGAVVSAGQDWLEARHQQALTGGGSHSGRLLPAQRRPLAQAIGAMARENDFKGILQVTDHLDAASLDSLPDNARRARVQALHRLNRRQEAFDLLVKLVGKDFNQHRSDPGMLLDFAELMVVEGQYDLALRLLAAVDRRLPNAITADRRIQLTIEKKLTTKSLHLDRGNFRIFFAPERDPHYADIVANYLQKEQKRLARWIPVAKKPRTIEVLLLDPRDFRESYAGSAVDLVGLYDGRIRVPLGQIGRVGTIAASILTHELAHALIADASDDQAPHWLHEGLAQMVEPGQKGLNPIAAMKSERTWLSFPLVEGALSGMATPTLARQGYEEALWSVIYLQTSRGPQIFAKLLEGYRQGKTEEQIFRQHLGTGPAGFDENLVTWARSGKVPNWVTEEASIE